MKGVSKEKPVKKKTVKSKLREKMSAGWMTVPSGAEIVPPDHPMCRSIVELIGDDLPVVNDGAMVGRFVREEPKTYRVDLRVSDNVVFDIERNGRGAVEHFLKEEMIKRGFDFSAGARYPIQRDRDITTGETIFVQQITEEHYEKFEAERDPPPLAPPPGWEPGEDRVFPKSFFNGVEANKEPGSQFVFQITFCLRETWRGCHEQKPVEPPEGPKKVFKKPSGLNLKDEPEGPRSFGSLEELRDWLREKNQ